MDCHEGPWPYGSERFPEAVDDWADRWLRIVPLHCRAACQPHVESNWDKDQLSQAPCVHLGESVR